MKKPILKNSEIAEPCQSGVRSGIIVFETKGGYESEAYVQSFPTLNCQLFTNDIRNY